MVPMCFAIVCRVVVMLTKDTPPLLPSLNSLYRALCRCRDGSAADVELKTKYFTAKIRLLPIEANVDDGKYGSESLTRALQSVEGFIDIIPYNEVRP